MNTSNLTALNIQCHHDQQESAQISFIQYVQSVVSIIDDFGNRFEEEFQDLLVLDMMEIVAPTAMEALYGAHEMGKFQFEYFVRERLVERTMPIDEPGSNKMKIFGQPNSDQELQEKAKNP